MYMIIKEFGKNVFNDLKVDLKVIAKYTTRIIPGIPEIDISDFEKEDFLEEIKLSEEVKNSIKDILDKILEKNEKLLLIIDELDRCKPSYAVKVLERIKHFFNDDRIVIFLAVNTRELSHTIKKFYGSYFNSGYYLEKLFDYKVDIPIVQQDRYFRNYFSKRRKI